MTYLEEANNPAWDFYKEFDLAVAQVAKTAKETGKAAQLEIMVRASIAQGKIHGMWWEACCEVLLASKQTH